MVAAAAGPAVRTRWPIISRFSRPTGDNALPDRLTSIRPVGANAPRSPASSEDVPSAARPPAVGVPCIQRRSRTGPDLRAPVDRTAPAKPPADGAAPATSAGACTDPAVDVTPARLRRIDPGEPGACVLGEPIGAPTVPPAALSARTAPARTAPAPDAEVGASAGCEEPPNGSEDAAAAGAPVGVGEPVGPATENAGGRVDGVEVGLTDEFPVPRTRAGGRTSRLIDTGRMLAAARKADDVTASPGPGNGPATRGRCGPREAAPTVSRRTRRPGACSPDERKNEAPAALFETSGAPSNEAVEGGDPVTDPAPAAAPGASTATDPAATGMTASPWTGA